MTYVITEPCQGTCERGRPVICIDCGACEPECPVEAIFPESAVPETWSDYTEKNAAFFE